MTITLVSLNPLYERVISFTENRNVSITLYVDDQRRETAVFCFVSQELDTVANLRLKGLRTKDILSNYTNE